LAKQRKPPEKLIEFGRVAGPYGVRGWVRVAVDDPELLATQRRWWLSGTEYAVQETKVHSGALLAKLAGVETPERARELKGRPVVIERPELAAGEHYWSDLIGLEVVNEQGVVLGVLKAMSHNGAHEVMEVAGERTRLLPWVPAYVKKVDLEKRRIEVEWEADW
jgi:16S rRNA processing protein RimM